MRQRARTYIITLLFTISFLVPRFVDIHILSHLSDDDVSISCELCDISVHSHQLDLINGESFDIEYKQHNIPSSFIVLVKYSISQEKIVSPTYIYNKPPPVL